MIGAFGHKDSHQGMAGLTPLQLISTLVENKLGMPAHELCHN